MKLFDIAYKDMLRSFRSAFLLVFMFGIPLFVTGMFYIMFGNLKGQEAQAFQPPITQVVIANLDTGSDDLAQGLAASLPPGSQVRSLGVLVVQALQSPELAQSIQVNLAADAAAAHTAVDSHTAGVALIIPADFSAQFANPNGASTVELYQDAGLSIGPQMVQAILSQLTESLSNVQITVRLMMEHTGAAGSNDPASTGQIYLAASQAFVALGQNRAENLLEVRSAAPAVEKSATSARQTMMTSLIGPIMGGMMIFFAFFTAASCAQTILKEEEEGTLPRLFTTPTPAATILQGKFLAVGLTVLVQISVLLGVSALVFGIPWGSLASVTLTVVGTVAAATGFGICFTSMLKTTRQGGTITGGLLTMTGMLGMLPVFTNSIPGSSSALGIVSRLVPQGWAVNGLLLGMRSGSLAAAALNLLGLLGWSVGLMAIGLWRFSKRYAKES